MKNKKEYVTCVVQDHSKKKCNTCEQRLVRAEVTESEGSIPVGSTIYYCYKCK